MERFSDFFRDNDLEFWRYGNSSHGFTVLQVVRIQIVARNEAFYKSFQDFPGRQSNKVSR